MDSIKHIKFGHRQIRFDKNRKYGGLAGHTATRKSNGWHNRVNQLERRRQPKLNGPRQTTGNDRWTVKVHLTTPHTRELRTDRRSPKFNAVPMTESAVFPAWVDDLENVAHHYDNDSHVVFEKQTPECQLELINQELNFLNQQILAAGRVGEPESELEGLEDGDFFVIHDEDHANELAEFIEVFSASNSVEEEDEWSFL